MYHKHEVTFTFYEPNQIWVIRQPEGNDLYLYPNGQIKDDDQIEYKANDLGSGGIDVPLEFE